MSSSTDSCSDYHHRLENSKLLPLFEQLQAIEFPIFYLENNIQKLKLGSSSICFAIYNHIYRTFRTFFLEINRPLDQYILNGKVIDREGFARDFFTALKEQLGHEQALPLYQYICPGHPLSKTQEIANIARKFRQSWHDRQPGHVNTDCRIHHERLSSHQSTQPTQPLHDGNRKSTFSRKIQQPTIAPPDIPWQAVKETGPVSEADDSGELDVSEDESVSPDEGIKSLNASSSLIDRIRTDPPEQRRVRRTRARSIADQVMDKDAGLRTMLDRIDKMETQQNTQLRSIQTHLSQLERDLSSHHAGERLDNHEVRIARLEHTHPPERHTRSRTSTRNQSVLEHDLHKRSHPRTHSPSPPPLDSPDPKIAEMEARRRDTMQSMHSRPLTGTNPVLADRINPHDSGFSSTQHNGPADDKTGNSPVKTTHLTHSTSHSNYFESRRDGDSSRTVERGRQSRHDSHGRGDTVSRSHSVVPTVFPSQLFNVNVEGEKRTDDTTLVDFDERIRLRLKERIKTAEDTLNACMETIRKDYVLLRRHN